MVLAAADLAPGLLLLLCLALVCRSWNQSLRRSPRSAKSCPVQLSVEARGGEKEKKKTKSHLNGDCEFTLNIRCHRTVGLLLPRLFSLGVGVAVVQGHRPAHFRVRSFPVRHACCSSLHCSTNTHTCAQPCHNSPQHLLHAGQSITQSCD